MSVVIQFAVPEAGAGEGAAVTAIWHESPDGAEYAEIGRSLLSALPMESGKYVWELAEADGANYQLIKTATAGGVVSPFGALLPPLPSVPGLQALHGNAKEFGAATWSEGDTVTMTLQGEQLVGGVVLEPVTRVTAVNAQGLFTLTPDKGATVTIKIANVTTGKVYYTRIITITQDSARNLSDY
jgi:hypothetical protein